jgi:hypothetical protein
MVRLIDSKEPSSKSKNILAATPQNEEQQPERTFYLFPKMAPEVRLKVWKCAILFIPGRVVCLQPTYSYPTPEVFQVCRESREEAKKTFSIIKSSQPTFPFTLFITYAKDTIYLNQWFRNPRKECESSVAHCAIHFYKDVMKEVRVLALNLIDLYRLTSAYRGGKQDLWKILHENCPNLKHVRLVIDGPVKGRTNIEFRRLYRISNANDNESIQRHAKLVYMLASLYKAAKEKKICVGLSKSVVSIDQAKKLPMKYGEKGNKDGSGVYDSYGLCDYPMRRVTKAKLVTGADSG